MAKYIYMFKEGNSFMKNLLGGKGANLAEMTNLGLPVPQGFTVSTEACTQYYEDGEKISDEILAQIEEGMKKLEDIAGKKFGDQNDPLLVSVRSGARASMPGMMDTILNLGLNDLTVEAIAKLTNNKRFAYDSYRRFIQMFSDVVMTIDSAKFSKTLDDLKEEKGVKYDTELTADDLKELVNKFKAIYRKELGKEFPSDPKLQLIESVKAVFRSWNNPRAIVYRRMNDIPASWGTAVNIQQMVFGNMGEDSGTGVAFTRDPGTGEKKIFGEYLMNAQGEDVVAGIRTPQPIETLKDVMSEVYDQFIAIAEKLEKHYRDMQDMEFTIQQGKLYMLQTRNGKRTSQAALQIAVDLVSEGLINTEDALLKVEPKQLEQILHPTFDPTDVADKTHIAKGLPASPGAAFGKVAFSAEEAKERAAKGEKVILVRLETSPEDIEGMVAAQGVLTVRGGMTSHAAVVARGMGKCCVAGCGEIKVDEDAKELIIGGNIFTPDSVISINGCSGFVYDGAIKTVEPEMTGNFAIIMEWADQVRRLHVRTNADTPKDAETAVKFGAEGIGLCRTEHMFFKEDRIAAVREMIVAKTEEQRRKALAKIEPMQREDFEKLYKALSGKAVNIRLLDPPLHEFLPQDDDDVKALADEMGMTFDELKATVESLHEFNPMLGHRGCRLAVTYPEIAEMQTRAIITAAINVSRQEGYELVPEIMVPLVGDVHELKYVKNVIEKTIKQVFAEQGKTLKYKIGTMIEVPRAALTADEIATEAEFFSFGTNDLTQMTFGFSRDDVGKFLNDYYEKKIFESDPFAKLDQIGVGKLVKMAVKLGREIRPNIHLGICGEHGGDPSTIEFCHKVGLDYVSCSPYRVPVAKLAAAHAAVKEKKAL